MSGHLSAEQIANWMIGERTTGEEQHVRDCSQCRAEVVRLEEALSQFRGAVRGWSEREAEVCLPAAFKPARRQPLRWVLAAATVVIVASIPICWNAVERQKEAEQAQADAALIEQVNAAVSRSVPSPMEPLTKLVSWDPGPREGNEEK